MFDPIQIQDELVKWMQEFVEQPNPLLGNWAPCPYARKARINNNIEILFFDDPSAGIEKSISAINYGKEVAVVCFDHTKISASELVEFVKNINQQLMPDYVVLEDHPDNVEHVNGVKMNFGLCGLLVIQRLDQLNTASDQLKSKGYYDHWDQTALDSVVSWRRTQ